MEKNIVDANWGLNGEDEKSLWEDWEVGKKDNDVVGKEGDGSGNGPPPSMRKVRISLGWGCCF